MLPDGQLLLKIAALTLAFIGGMFNARIQAQPYVPGKGEVRNWYALLFFLPAGICANGGWQMLGRSERASAGFEDLLFRFFLPMTYLVASFYAGHALAQLIWRGEQVS